MLQSHLFRAYVASLNKGSLIQHMFTKQIAQFWLPVPPLDEQVALVAQTQERLDVVGRTIAAFEHNTRRQEGLRRSLLSAALTGQLSYQPTSTAAVQEKTSA